MATSSLSNFGGQNAMLMRNDISRSESLVAMLTSCAPHMGLQVQRSVGGLEDAVVGLGQKRPYYPTFDGMAVEEAEDGDEGVDDFSHGPVEKKRRLSFDQVRSLERNFEMENKLEPERKMQLAKDLGLQPRQVAVWFQNRRARWKTKQLERDYEVLNSGYNKLKADLEVILREKNSLKAEVQRLSGKTNSEDSEDCRSSGQAQCGSETTVRPSEAHADDSLRSVRNSDPLKNYHHSRSMDISSARKDVEEQSTSSGSNSSEILDADSPRTSDSSNGAGIPEDQIAYYHQQLPQETFMGPSNVLHAEDEFCPQAEAPPPMFQVKLEDGCAYQEDPPCNYFLPQMDEQSVLPWWDWP